MAVGELKNKLTRINLVSEEMIGVYIACCAPEVSWYI